MPHDRFEYDIQVTTLLAPIGDLKFVAKVSMFVRQDGGGRGMRLPSPVGKYWGRDRAEADGKARAALGAWLASRTEA